MSLLTTSAAVALAIVMLGVALAFIRLVRGPDLPNRVVAFDLLSIQVVGLIAGSAILTDTPLFLDAAFILALLAFLATIAFARYMERGMKAGREPDA